MNSSIPSSPENTALCTVLSDDYVVGFLVLIGSLLRVHPNLELPFIVVHHPDLAPLSPLSRELILHAYPKVEFHEVNADLYQNVWANRDGPLATPPRLRSAFFILEAFNLGRFSRVITLDSDMLCMGDLSELFTHSAPFAATVAYAYPEGSKLDYFNSGVLVIGKTHLTGETYQRLLDHKISETYQSRKGKADQAILNDFFPINAVVELDERYNMTKRRFADPFSEHQSDPSFKDTRILHFVGGKPWQEHSAIKDISYTGVEALWWHEFHRFISLADFSRLYRMQQRRLLETTNAVNTKTVTSLPASPQFMNKLRAALWAKPTGGLLSRLFPNRWRVQTTRDLFQQTRRKIRRLSK